MFAIRFTPEAIDDLRTYSKTDRKRILDGIDACLRDDPGRETRNNKSLRPNRLAERELRLGRFRVFYDIDEAEGIVKIEAVGDKRGNRVCISGREFTL